ncbi:MAG: hypothetical protein N4A74_20415 [Carboxylicivirga sp.]|jgi:hypothetical protein|nr:hypothetical protein [Carboxylicivirga sp.]
MINNEYRFFEQFDGGFDIGCAIFKTKDKRYVSGALVYTEYIYGDQSFVISVDVEGEIQWDEDRNEGILVLKGIAYEIIEGDPDIDYCLDERIAEIGQSLFLEGKIEGRSIDDQNLEGRFVLRNCSDYPN